VTDTFKEYLEKQNQIYFGFLALPLVLYAVVYLPVKDSTITSTGNSTLDLIYYLGSVALFALVYLCWRLYQSNLKRIEKNRPLMDKLKRHRSVSSTLYALGLLLSLLSIAMLWVTKHQLFVATYPMLLLLISFCRPTARRLEKELPLSDDELAMIKDKRKKG
jgi:cytochrome b561